MQRYGFVAAALVAAAVTASPASASVGIASSLIKRAPSSAAHKIERNAEKAVIRAIFKDFSRAVEKSRRVRGVRRPAF